MSKLEEKWQNKWGHVSPCAEQTLVFSDIWKKVSGQYSSVKPWQKHKKMSNDRWIKSSRAAPVGHH